MTNINWHKNIVKLVLKRCFEYMYLPKERMFINIYFRSINPLDLYI